MSSALEFVAPLNVAATNFNRNPRKLHILQANFGEGLLPVVVGTYPVDPFTGLVVNQTSPTNLLSKNVQGATQNQTILSAAPNNALWRIWGIQISTETSFTAGLVTVGINSPLTIFADWNMPAGAQSPPPVYFPGGLLQPANGDIRFFTGFVNGSVDIVLLYGGTPEQ